MKELSIEEKALRYDKVSKEVKDFFEGKQKMYSNVNQTLEYLFPELKESEDEKFLRYLIDCCKSTIESNDKGLELSMDTTKRLFAWLEKQKPIELSGDDLSALQNWAMFITDKKKELELNNWFVEATIEVVNKMKKILIQYPDIMPKSLDEDDKSFWLEKQGEQKPADTVESKFKNGQWIVWQDKCYKVNYNGCGYELVDQDGLSTSLEYGTIDENAHLWTIQDAKDGDVLASKDTLNILIFRKLDTNVSFSSHYNIYEQVESDWGTQYFIPATKEQRDLLFQKMKEAGYEWNAEKKELKRIEQKPAWSEEDEKISKAIIKRINGESDYLSVDLSSAIYWIENVKDRVQPNQEWSEEDEETSTHEKSICGIPPVLTDW